MSYIQLKKLKKSKYNQKVKKFINIIVEIGNLEEKKLNIFFKKMKWNQKTTAPMSLYF